MESYDIPDSTDWLATSLTGLSTLENALHCQICKEFFDTPMITSCCHTFCSKCIRTALSSDGKCPACRSSDQASKLRNNWQLQEIVATFIDARPATLKVAKEHKEGFQALKVEIGKRKRDASHMNEEPIGRTTRSKSRRISSQASQADYHGLDVETEDEPLYQPEQDDIQDDGLVECPLGCGKRMKIEQVEPHLDRCEDEKLAEAKAAAKATTEPLVRLNELNYGMMKERELARKMKELGIPSTGPKSLLIKRHTEWVNIWNANCDSSRRRSKRQLLDDLNVWERTQGGHAPNVVNGIMKKDFDGKQWMKKHDNSFGQLIADAQRSRKENAPKKQTEPEEQDVTTGPIEDVGEMAAVDASQDVLHQTEAVSYQPDTGQNEANSSSNHLQEPKPAESLLSDQEPTEQPSHADDEPKSLNYGPPAMSNGFGANSVELNRTARMPMFASPHIPANDIKEV